MQAPTQPGRVSDLSRIVAIHEYAKSVLGLSHQVNLHALDAIVRGLQGGAGLRGFAEVSRQMRDWTRELHGSLESLTELSAQQVQVFSELVKQRRLTALLSAADVHGDKGSALGAALIRRANETEVAEMNLRRLRRRVRNMLEDLVQLGLLARVLSSAAMIESTAGTAAQWRELTHVSEGFAARSEQVGELIRLMLRTDKELSA